MPSGDTYGAKNISTKSPVLGFEPKNHGNESPDNKTGSPTRRLGHIDVTIENSNDHIDLLVDQMDGNSLSTNGDSISTRSGNTTLTESAGNTSTDNETTSTGYGSTSTDSDNTQTEIVYNTMTEIVYADGTKSATDSLPIRSRSDDPESEQPQPLKNRHVRVRTGTGAFLGAIGSVAGLGVAAASSGAVVAKLALIGAAVGTVFSPGVGTVVGGVIGGAIGAIVVGGAGATIGALLVKAGGRIQSHFKGPGVPPPDLPRPSDVTNREELNQALKQIKETYAFDAPWFKQIAWHANVSRKAIKANQAKIDQAFGAIVDKFAERTEIQSETGKVENARIPTREYLNATLAGLMLIYGAPSTFDIDVDTQNGHKSYKDELAERFAAFLERYPDADPDTVFTVAGAYTEYFDPEYLGPFGRSVAFDEFAAALSERMAIQYGDEIELPKEVRIWAMADSAATAANVYNSIQLPNGDGTGDANATVVVDPIAQQVAKTWMGLVRPLIEQGLAIDPGLASAVQSSLQSIYSKSDIGAGTVEKFEEFLTGTISRTGTVSQWTAESVEDGLSKLDRHWTRTGEGLDAAQDAFTRWAEEHIGNHRIVSTRMVDRYLLENYGISQPGIE